MITSATKPGGAATAPAPPGSPEAVPSPDALLDDPGGDGLSVYVHLPFCREHCPYCDFVTIHATNPRSAWRAEYPALVARELALALERFPGLRRRRLVTRYLGGGTPSLYAPGELAPIMAAIAAAWGGEHLVETTMEANPGSLRLEQLDDYVALGIDRISLGVQTLRDDALAELGRAHDAAEARRAMAAVGAHPGLRSWSADLIFGFPRQTLDDLARDLEEFVAAGAPHVSVYGLTLHGGTPYEERWRRGELPLPDEESVLAMFRATRGALREAGYEAYEFSNFARPGHRARHNAAYWELEPVLPLGVSACGFLAGRRVANPRSLDRWRAAIEAGELPWEWEAPLEGRQRAGEVMMCALRRGEGASWAWLAARAGVDVRELYAQELAAAAARGWLDPEAPSTHLRLSEAGIELSDEFFATLF